MLIIALVKKTTKKKHFTVVFSDSNRKKKQEYAWHHERDGPSMVLINYGAYEPSPTY